MKKISLKAVILGVIIDIGGSALAGFLLGIIFIIIHKSGEGVLNLQEYYSNLTMMLISLLVGLLFVILGGFTASVIAPKAKITNACVVGFVAMILGLLLGKSLPPWYNISALLLTMPCAYFGGYLGKLLKKQSAE